MKNNPAFKILALLLVPVLCAPTFISCNNGTRQPSDAPSKGASSSVGDSDASSKETPGAAVDSADPSKETPGAAVGEEKPVLPRFDGETVSFYVNGFGLQPRSIDIGENDDPAHIVNVAVKKRNEQIKKELGVDIVMSELPSMSSTYPLLHQYLAAGIYKYDVVALYQYFDIGLALLETKNGAHAFYNLYDLPKGKSYLNLEASYWDQTYLDALSYKGTGFFITGDLSLSFTGTVFVSYVNADMWAEYADRIKTLEHSGGYSDVYDIVKNGYWTMDLWTELADLCYEDDGDKKKDYEDQAGFMTYDEQLNNIMTDILAAGSKVHYGSIKADGTPSIDILSDKNIAFYQKLYTLLCESNTVNMPWVGGEDGKDVTYILDLFADGNVLLNVNTLSQAEEYLSDMKDEYLVMPPAYV